MFQTAPTMGEDCFELYQVFVIILENVVTLGSATRGIESVSVENH